MIELNGKYICSGFAWVLDNATFFAGIIALVVPFIMKGLDMWAGRRSPFKAGDLRLMQKFQFSAFSSTGRYPHSSMACLNWLLVMYRPVSFSSTCFNPYDVQGNGVFFVGLRYSRIHSFTTAWMLSGNSVSR